MQTTRCLVVDDHDDVRHIISNYLTGFPDVIIVGECRDGEEAVQAVSTLHPDVVLMDVSMPRRNGLEATRIIKERWPETRVILLTMYDQEFYRQRALEVKADAFLHKSVLKRDLRSIFDLTPEK